MRTFIVYSWLVIFIYLFTGCLSRKGGLSSSPKNTPAMPGIKDTIRLKKTAFYDVQLNSRGALGLALGASAIPEGIVTVERQENQGSVHAMAGDTITAVFRISAVATGKCTVSFFETQPWNKAFTPIVQKEYIVIVE